MSEDMSEYEEALADVPEDFWADDLAPEDFSVWTKRDGTTIPVSDMSDRHLANAIRLLERNVEACNAADVDSYEDPGLAEARRERAQGFITAMRAEQKWREESRVHQDCPTCGSGACDQRHDDPSSDPDERL